jgi:hypothetical protein
MKKLNVVRQTVTYTHDYFNGKYEDQYTPLYAGDKIVIVEEKEIVL